MSDVASCEPRMSVDRGAYAYHQGRPPYPDAVYALLVAEFGLAPGCRVLEVGAGSGIATDALLSHGAQVTAVEPGANLARLLRQRHPAAALTVVTADFEPLCPPRITTCALRRRPGTG